MTAAASTWMQVVFGGLGVSVAIVAAVIAYFAWVQPNSPPSPSTPAEATAAGTVAPATTGTAAPAAVPAATVALRTLSPTVGAGYLSAAGDDLTMECATGQSTDRHRTVAYDLLGRYTDLKTEVRVPKARDDDTPLQIKIFADGPEIANRTVTRKSTTRLSVPLSGVQRIRIQLTCQFPDGEIMFAAPHLIHT